MWTVVSAALAVLISAAACGEEPAPPSAGQGPAATTTCASSGGLTMWERSGGNKQMVDMLVEAWNTKNLDCKITLTYIPTPRWSARSLRASPRGRCPT